MCAFRELPVTGNVTVTLSVEAYQALGRGISPDHFENSDPFICYFDQITGDIVKFVPES